MRQARPPNRKWSALYNQYLGVGYSDADFNDPHRLSVAGAEKFSAWLATNVVALGLGMGGG